MPKVPAREPRVFFSSRLRPERIADLRETLHARRAQGSLVWVPERSDARIAPLQGEEAELACLRHVRDCEGFVCVLDQTYGSPWGAGDMSILELELFMAALKQRPIAVFLLEPFEPDPRLAVLLRLIEAAHPGTVERLAGSERQVIGRIERACDRLVGRDGPPVRGGRGALGRILEWLAVRRAAPLQSDRLDVQFLAGELAPLGDRRPDTNLIQTLLVEAEARASIPERLAGLWKVIRHLSAADYRRPEFSELLPQWDRSLRLWASAAAWYGLHGHVFLGRLAAVNTLIELGKHGPLEEPAGLELQGGHGAVASEYYSIAKQLPMGTLKRRLYWTALESIDRAFAERSGDPSGLHAIRGSVLFRLGNPFAAVEEYETALRLRRAAGEDDGRIGEAEVELGFGYFFAGRPFQGGALIESGVERLRPTTRIGFTVRALRKLSLFYWMTLRAERGREVRREAQALAEKAELQGQLDQLTQREEADDGDPY